MNTIIFVALALVAVAAAAPAEKDLATVIRYIKDQQPEGNFNFEFETSDGVKQQQTGELQQGVDENNKPVFFLATRGFYSYYNPDGTIEEVKYTADQNGYHAEGPSIPKSESR